MNVVYVAQRGNQYKVGFSRGHAQRRAYDARARLLFTIPAGDRPSVLESIIHTRFRSKAVNAHPRCEWFTLQPGDLDWLRGLAAHLAKT